MTQIFIALLGCPGCEDALVRDVRAALDGLLGLRLRAVRDPAALEALGACEPSDDPGGKLPDPAATSDATTLVLLLGQGAAELARQLGLPNPRVWLLSPHPDGLAASDRPGAPAHNGAVDLHHRHWLQNTGLGFEVLGGAPLARCQAALRLLQRHSQLRILWNPPAPHAPASAAPVETPVAAAIDTEMPSQAPHNWACGCCSDPVCEQRLFARLLRPAEAQPKP